MRFQIYLCLGQCFILCNLLVFTKALVGPDVRQAEDGELTFVVALAMLNPDDDHLFQQYCTGALVTLRDVLTAEHCVDDRDIVHAVVLIGCKDMRNCHKYPVFWWLTYKQWARHRGVTHQFTHNDVAMIRLRKDITEPINPGTMSQANNLNLIDQYVTLVGWGRKETGQKPMIMEVVDVKVMSLTECRNRMASTRARTLNFEDNVFCSATPSCSLASSGDSGGPVIYVNSIVGITVATPPSRQLESSVSSQKVNVHVKLHVYRDFIDYCIHNLYS